MQNITMQTDGNILTVKIDLSKRLGKSKSGKTIMIASSDGNQKIEGFNDCRIGINCYTKEGV